MKKEYLQDTNEEKIECPICFGSGKISPPKKKFSDNRKEMAGVLLDNGYGVREIQRFLQYKSPRSVSVIKEKLQYKTP